MKIKYIYLLMWVIFYKDGGWCWRSAKNLKNLNKSLLILFILLAILLQQLRFHIYFVFNVKIRFI